MKKLTEIEIKNKIESLQDWDFYENALHTDCLLYTSDAADE